MNEDAQEGRVDAPVLGQLMAAQSMFLALPSVDKLAGFVAEALEIIPGTAAVAACLCGATAPKGTLQHEFCGQCGEPGRDMSLPSAGVCGLSEVEGIVSFPLVTLGAHYGRFLFAVERADVFDPYRPFLSNFANVVAIAVENRRQEALLQSANEELQARKDTLEKEVAQRTRELTESNTALRQASRYSRNLIESCLDPLVTINVRGEITDVNQATERITGVDRHDLIGTDFSNYFSEPDVARAGYRIVFAEGRVIDYPLAIRHVSGALTEVLYNASVYRNDLGEVLGVIAAARDITGQKAEEKARRDLEHKLQQAEKAESLGRMAGAVAHQFNNMLGAVIGNLELAVDDLINGQSGLALIAEAMAAAQRAANVSSTMLTYIGQAAGSQEVLDASETCRNHMPALMDTLPKSTLLQAHFPASGPAIKANAHQIQQVLMNLVTNAWEAFDAGPGEIHLALETVQGADIPVKARFPLDWHPRSAPHACLEVRDTGRGIAQGDIEKVFDPFFTSKFAGRGLGLPMLLGIVRAHGGGITVESEAGRGSVFRVYFPVVASSEKVRAEPGPQAVGAGQAKAVLVVEDEPAMRKLSRCMLDRMGIPVLEAKDASDAIEVYKKNKDRIGCVISDLTMPGVDGWELLAVLRKITPGIPVILTSGYDQAEIMQGDHAEWPQAFLGKPYRVSDLREALAAALKDSAE